MKNGLNHYVFFCDIKIGQQLLLLTLTILLNKEKS